MKDSVKKAILIVLAAALVIGIIALVSAIVKGAFHLLGGLLDTVLGIVIILGLVAIVIWMFSYAKRNRKSVERWYSGCHCRQDKRWQKYAIK